MSGGTYLPVHSLLRSDAEPLPRRGDLKEVAAVDWQNYRISQLENGAIVVAQGGHELRTAKPGLREIARHIGVDVLNSMGNAKNTRTLGSDIIKALS